MLNRRQTTLALWSLFAATAAVRIGYGAIMPVLPVYAQQHGLSTLMISHMTNAYMISAALFQTYAGQLGDRWGRRPVILAGIWLYTIAAGLFMLDGGPWFYVLLRGLEGLGACAFGPTVRAYVADLVPESDRGKVFGQLSTFDMAGILFGPMVGVAAQSFLGPRAPFAVCALLGLLAAVPMLLLPRVKSAAAEAGPEVQSTGAREVSARSILGAPAFWAVVLPNLGFAYLNGLYSVIWSIYMKAIGGTDWQLNLSFTMFALPTVLLMMPFGALADRVGRPLLIMIGGTISALATLTYGLLPYPNALIGFGVIDGAAAAMFIPASQAFMADVAPSAIRGKFMGLAGAINTGASVVAVWLIGYLYDRIPTLWLWVIGALALFFSCSSAVLIMVRRPAAQLRQALERLV